MEHSNGKWRKPALTFLEIIIVLAVLVLLIAILFPVLPGHTHEARQTQCSSNERQIVLGIQMYQQDHVQKFPDKTTIWQDLHYPPKTLICPTYGLKKGNGYGYNASISGKMLEDHGMPDAPNLPVITDSNTPTHLLETRSDIDPRHHHRAVVGYADGHVTLQPLTAIPNLQPQNNRENPTK